MKKKISQFTGAIASMIVVIAYTCPIVTTGSMITAFGGSVARNYSGTEKVIQEL